MTGQQVKDTAALVEQGLEAIRDDISPEIITEVQTLRDLFTKKTAMSASEFTAKLMAIDLSKIGAFLDAALSGYAKLQENSLGDTLITTMKKTQARPMFELNIAGRVIG